MILDLSSASRLFGQISPVVGSYEQHPIVRVMQDNASVFPLARSLEVKSPAEKLFSSTADSYSLTNPKLPIKESDTRQGEERPVRSRRGRNHRHRRQARAASSLWAVPSWMANIIMSAPDRQPRSRAQHDELADFG